MSEETDTEVGSHSSRGESSEVSVARSEREAALERQIEALKQESAERERLSEERVSKAVDRAREAERKANEHVLKAQAAEKGIEDMRESMREMQRRLDGVCAEREKAEVKSGEEERSSRLQAGFQVSLTHRTR